MHGDRAVHAAASGTAEGLPKAVRAGVNETEPEGKMLKSETWEARMLPLFFGVKRETLRGAWREGERLWKFPIQLKLHTRAGGT